MALMPKLERRQGQQLGMTPQLQQAIRLLQLSNVELCTFIEGEVERNPLLEAEDVAPEPALAAEVARGSDDDGGGDDHESGGDWSHEDGAVAINGGGPVPGETNGAAALNGG